MRNARRPMGRFFCLPLVVAAAGMMPWTVQAQANGPAMTRVVEGLFGHKSGTEKKNAALSFVQTAITATDAVAGQNIVDAGKFQEGLGKVIDGVVQCLNASVWAKAKSA
jgi:hypothetical protein